MKKKPIIAGILNFVFPGLGYLYIGTRKTFAIILMVGMIIGMVGDISYVDLVNLEKTSKVVLFMTAFLWFFAFGYDAYTEARSIKS
jgi:hypothetical protein